MTGLLPFEVCQRLDRLAERAHHVDVTMAGGDRWASTLLWWRDLIRRHHVAIAPLDADALLALPDSAFFREACAIRRRWTHHVQAAAA